MDTKRLWESIYRTKAPDMVSWYRQHLDRSLALIERVAHQDTSIIDVGGGASTLVDDLRQRGYTNLTVLDASEAALEITKKRMGSDAEQVRWLAGDIIEIELEQHAYDLWHDRAVFHFLTTPEQRLAYVRQVIRAVKRSGHVIVSTFGPEGPTSCSGLKVMRYDAESLHIEFGRQFRLMESSQELHQTPFGTTQQFLYCYCRLELE